MELNFLYCTHCKKIAVEISNAKNVPTICCVEPMKPIVANTVDAAKEKHVPVVTVNGDKIEVAVGSVEHPMVPEHWIEFIVLETKKGFQIKYLNAGEAPKTVFTITDDEAVAVYEYCNLHGLWKTVI